MKIASLKNLFITASILVAAASGIAHAHSGGGVIDPNGDNPSATILAAVNCTGGSDYLLAQVRDESAPVPGLLLSLHVHKGQKMTSITDTVPGDAFHSPEIRLDGGDGQYLMSLTKTNAGARNFDVIWHCMSNSGIHTDTDISVYQIQ
ncbi:MAG: hypothetical protein Q7U38_20195 [Methylobacter sp.]|nr:hypothetical protein [Methylobacter sp.]MDP2096998.1 hypothetical protein [Methylobacter sp.]MDP2428911.1 hypothetical protein [Methylobacter sp.]MDP3056326.1 hypothetical protein [Methylobacter sp.]MDP3361109.1 hypothetical protein [Methylobacter sp.]